MGNRLLDMNLYFAMGGTTSDVASIVSRCKLLNGDHNVAPDNNFGPRTHKLC